MKILLDECVHSVSWLAQLGEGARASARFNVRCRAVQKMPGPLALICAQRGKGYWAVDRHFSQRKAAGMVSGELLSEEWEQNKALVLFP